MARWITMATGAELIRAIVDRYRTGSRLEKHDILDEFVAVTGYHGKHAIRLFKPRAATLPPPRWRVRYGPEACEALVVLSEASDRLCLKRPSGPLQQNSKVPFRTPYTSPLHLTVYCALGRPISAASASFT
jgi:hypothetical protein